MLDRRGLCLHLATLGRLLEPILFLHQGSPPHTDANVCGLELQRGLRLAGPDDDGLLFARRLDQFLATSLDIAWSRPDSQQLCVLSLQPSVLEKSV